MSFSPSVQAHIKQSTNGRYKSLQGTYNPRIGGPYKGPAKKPAFRSKLELRLMVMLDNPDANNVISWQYESKKIPYQDKSTVEVAKNGVKSFPTRHYIIDFIVQLKNGMGIRTFWIEVKSIHDIEVNKKRKMTKNAKISEKIRIKNYCKWMAAAKAAKSCGANFMVVTEKELDALKSMLFN
jgi:hypothetical protein